jgi:hypothetical protein
MDLIIIILKEINLLSPWYSWKTGVKQQSPTLSGYFDLVLSWYYVMSPATDKVY